MTSLESSVIARYKYYGKNFEILVNPEAAFSLREGSDISVEDLLAAYDVFKDANKGEKASEKDLIDVFGSVDVADIAEKIVKHGELQLTTEQRRKIRANKRRRVVEIIARDAINPQTNTPHPPSRIESAMEEAKINIDISKSEDELVNEVMEAIRPIIPIRFEKINIAIKIPAEYASKLYGEISALGTIEKDEWQPDGSWICIVEIPAGMQNHLYSHINKLTKGEAETKLL